MGGPALSYVLTFVVFGNKDKCAKSENCPTREKMSERWMSECVNSKKIFEK